MKRHIYTVAVLFLLITVKPQAQSSAERGILIKFNRAYSDELLKSLPSNANAVAVNMLKNKDLRGVNEKHGAKTLRRVLPTAGKFEEKHRQAGLDQWFLIEFDKQKERNPDRLRDYRSIPAALFAEEEKTVQLYGENGVFANDKANFSYPEAVFNDAQFSSLWYLDNDGSRGGVADADIDFSEGMELLTGTDEVVVAVLDQGIDFTHEDLQEAAWVNEAEANGLPGVDDDDNGYVDDLNGWDFVNNDAVRSHLDHGTHVGGLLAAKNNNGVGISSIGGSSAIKLMSLMVFDTASGAGFAEAFIYAADNGASIAQNSWGYLDPGVYNQLVLDAIDYFIGNAGYDETGSQMASKGGGLVVFAAGNANSEEHFYPAFYEPVISVAATDIYDRRAYYSNYGAYVDISAPGGSVSELLTRSMLSCRPNNRYKYEQGTSQAAPLVSAALATMIQHYYEPEYTLGKIKDMLYLSADPVDSLSPDFEGKLGSGRLNLFNALTIGKDVIPPNPVTQLRLDTVGVEEVTIWCNVPYDEWGIYRLVASVGENLMTDPDLSGVEVVEWFPVKGEDSLKLVVKGLSFNMHYRLVVQAEDLAGNRSDFSEIIAFQTYMPPKMELFEDTIHAELYPFDTLNEQIWVYNRGDYPLKVQIEYLNAYDTSSFALNQEGLNSRGGIYDYEVSELKFRWENIVDTEWVNLNDDDFIRVKLPFEFPFFGENYDSITISSNGYLTVLPETPPWFYQTSFPQASVPNGILAAVRKDFNPAIAGKLYYQGDNTRFIVQYSNYRNLGDGKNYTFQIIIYPNGDVRTNYLNMNQASGSLLWLEDPAGEVLVSRGEWSQIPDSLSLYLKAPELFMSHDYPEEILLQPGDSSQIGIQFKANSYFSGDYSNIFRLHSNDPLAREKDIVFVLKEKSAPELAVNQDTVFLGDLLQGFDYEGVFELYNKGNDYLKVNDIVVSEGINAESLGADSLFYLENTLLKFKYTAVNKGRGYDKITLHGDFINSPLELTVYADVLARPVISISKDSLTFSVYPTDTVHIPVTVSSLGDDDLQFRLAFQSDEGVFPITHSSAPSSNGFSIEKENGEWVDISTTGTTVLMNEGDYYKLDLIDSFYYFNKLQNSIYIHTSGVVSFGPSYTEGHLLDSVTKENPGAYIKPIPFRGILKPETKIKYKIETGKLVISYLQLWLEKAGSFIDFQLVLHDNGQINLNYPKGLDVGDSYIGWQDHRGVYGCMLDSLLLGKISDYTTVVMKEMSGLVSADQLVQNTLSKGDSQEITLVVPTGGAFSGNYHGFVNIISNDPFQEVSSVPVTIVIAGTSPVLYLNTDEIGFKGTYIGNTDYIQIEVSNLGEKSVFVDSVRVGGGGFTFWGFPGFMSGHETRMISSSFTPDQIGEVGGEYKVYANGIAQEMLSGNWYGRGLRKATLSELDTLVEFGEVQEGELAYEYLKLINEGTDTLYINNFHIFNSSFTAEIDHTRLHYLDTATVSITFNPFGLGEKSAILSLATNDAHHENVQILLRGISTEITGILDSEKIEISVYPNPVRESLVLEIPVQTGTAPIAVSLTNITGREVLQEYRESNDGKLTLHGLDRLSPGSYILIIRSGEYSYKKIVLVEH